MALVVEDGTGKSTAEAYISVTAADAYFVARGNAAWAALATDAKEQALRKGADYLEGQYRERWKGARLTAAQALSWPRYGVVVDGFDVATNAVPVAVANANAEMALRASSGDLLADQGAQVKSETVGPISVTYADGARQGTAYKAIDAMLAAYLSGGAGQIAVVRS
ncbi:MAG: hypothetical protein J7507_12110 [Pseudoxanthomonas sp.]|nr:hypothetical protein [Pseudoxanthomonas sp.]